MRFGGRICAHTRRGNGSVCDVAPCTLKGLQIMWYPDSSSSSRWSTPYVFIAGVVVGVILGWMFQGIIGMLVRFALLALLVVGVLFILNMWRKSKSAQSTSFDDIPEADWRDLDSRRRR